MTFEINMTRQLEVGTHWLEPNTNLMTYLLSSKIPAIVQTSGFHQKKAMHATFELINQFFRCRRFVLLRPRGPHPYWLRP